MLGYVANSLLRSVPPVRSTFLSTGKCLNPFFVPRGYCRWLTRNLSTTSVRSWIKVPGTTDVTHPFYNYTSGRWLYNEQIRLNKRHLTFNVSALLLTISKSVSKNVESIVNLSKIAEGGSYRVFEATFSDGLAVIARLPYPCTIPHNFGVDSEVATIRYLRSKGLPIPEVLTWNSSRSNPVGSEYIIMLKAEGKELEQTWHAMGLQVRMNVVEKIVDVERSLFQLEFPANGSLYHKHFLDCQENVTYIPLDSEGDFCIGPSSEFLWWYKARDQISTARGPWRSAADAMQSVGLRELSWLERFGERRFPREYAYREFYDKRKVDPAVQIQTLKDYLEIVPLIVPDEPELCKPTIRHPDLSPNNLFISDSGDITGPIDWQHSSILPLFLQAKIPKHFQNYGDEESESFRPPGLPDDMDTLPPDEQEAQLELYRRRQVHYFYVGHTSRNNELHFKAMTDHSLVVRNKLYDVAGRPREGDNVSLKAELIRSIGFWHDIAAKAKDVGFPIKYSEEEVSLCLDIDDKQKEVDGQLQVVRDFCPIDIEDWVPNELFEDAGVRMELIKGEMMGFLDTDDERREVLENWPFQDHVEIDW